MQATSKNPRGAGRKPKADEDRVRDLAVNALVKIFGSEEKAFEHIGKQAQEGSFPHLNLLLAYGYGKPKEKVQYTTDTPMTWQEIRNYKAEEVLN